MPRKALPLTVTRIRHAKASDYPLWDGGGLHLIRAASGSQLWRLKYSRPDGRENRIGPGAYPELSLADARDARDVARAALRQGIDPSVQRQSAKQAARHVELASFEVAATRWIAVKRKAWAAQTLRKAEYVVSSYLVPALRRQSITTLSTKQAADALATLGEHAPSLARKARQYLSGIVNQAIRDGLREDGKLLSLRGTVPTHGRGHIPAATDPREVAMLVKAIDAYPVPVTRAALRLAMLTAMRPGIYAAGRRS